jgi:hypothetical protein
MTFVRALFRADYNYRYLRVPRGNLIGQDKYSVIGLVLLWAIEPHHRRNIGGCERIRTSIRHEV